MKQIVETVEANFSGVLAPEIGFQQAKEGIQQLIDEKAVEGYYLVSCTPTTTPFSKNTPTGYGGMGYGYSFTSGFVLIFQKDD